MKVVLTQSVELNTITLFHLYNWYLNNNDIDENDISFEQWVEEEFSNMDSDFSRIRAILNIYEQLVYCNVEIVK